MTDADHLKEIGRLRAALEDVKRTAVNHMFDRGPKPDVSYILATINKVAREALHPKGHASD